MKLQGQRQSQNIQDDRNVLRVTSQAVSASFPTDFTSATRIDPRGTDFQPLNDSMDDYVKGSMSGKQDRLK